MPRLPDPERWFYGRIDTYCEPSPTSDRQGRKAGYGFITVHGCAGRGADLQTYAHLFRNGDIFFYWKQLSKVLCWRNNLNNVQVWFNVERDSGKPGKVLATHISEKL